MSVAGLRPGLGRGGITHSFDVIDPGVAGTGESGEIEAETEPEGLAANAGTRGAGVPAGASGVAILCLFPPCFFAL